MPRERLRKVKIHIVRYGDQAQPRYRFGVQVLAQKTFFGSAGTLDEFEKLQNEGRFDSLPGTTVVLTGDPLPTAWRGSSMWPYEP